MSLGVEHVCSMTPIRVWSFSSIIGIYCNQIRLYQRQDSRKCKVDGMRPLLSEYNGFWIVRTAKRAWIKNWERMDCMDQWEILVISNSTWYQCIIILLFKHVMNFEDWYKTPSWQLGLVKWEVVTFSPKKRRALSLRGASVVAAL